MDIAGSIDEALSSISASQATYDLLRDLHTQALTEPGYVSTDSQPASAALERFVALEPDKCALVYLLLRSSGARFVVEAGTSFGVSTIYLALAVSQNAVIGKQDGKVIATERETSKARRAREHWERAGDDLERWIELREGDLLQTLACDLPNEIDFLLLDIWSPLALPTLKLVRPYMKVGALVAVDNATVASEGYADLTAYLADSSNGFRSTISPYTGGLKFAVLINASVG